MTSDDFFHHHVLDPGVEENAGRHPAAVFFIKSDGGALSAENVAADPVFAAEIIKEAKRRFPEAFFTKGFFHAEALKVKAVVLL